MAWKNWQKDGKMYLPCNLWKDIFWPKHVGRLKKTTCRGFIIATVLLGTSNKDACLVSLKFLNLSKTYRGDPWKQHN